ncbi:MAG: F0F1 ATP synthase subunit epsilon [Elusimicrobia bacterium]|nr:F0F1 ATP synthase subunit epsilon [Elusimicrobiota bacterium]
MKTFLLEIITPDKVAYSNNVESVVVPAYNGELGVLPGHIDYLSLLTPGEIRIKNGDDLELLAISGGFVEIHPKNVVVLCETAESAEEIDIERANLSKMRAKEKLKEPNIDSIQIQAAIQRATARIKVIGDIKKRKKSGSK